MITTRRKRFVLVTSLCLMALMLLFPQPAHAGVGTEIASALLEIIYALLEFIQTLIGLVITGTGNLIQVFANMKVSSGGQIVYTVWRVLRDFCNMAFIIALILMAFGTIFDSLELAFLKPYSINGRGVIFGFLMAAILLNFSLAIGQAVVGASNQATKIVLKLMPENIGVSLAGALQLAATNMNSSMVETNKGVLVIDNVPVAGLTPEQVATTNTLGTPTAKLQFSDCIKNKQGTPSKCYETYIVPLTASGRAKQSFLQTSRAYLAGATLGVSCYFTDCSFKGITGIGGSDPKVMFRLIFDKLYAVFLSGVLMISFVVVLLFMLVRIPALWILLALSPLAWTSLAFPGLRSQGYDAWWKQFWAWNLFSPLYLFVLYFGILFINNVGSAVASLASQDGTVPTVMGFIGSAFAYLMAGVVLIGGTAAVVKASFMGGTLAGQFTGNLTKGLGVGGPAGAAAPVSRFLRITPAFQGAIGGIKAQYERRVTKPQKEIEERYKAKFSGGGAVEALERNRIRDQMKKNEDEGLSVADMKTKLGNAKVGSTEYFALSQALLKEGVLDSTQMKDLGVNAEKLGGIGKSAIRQQIARKIAEQTKEKKFRDDPEPPASASDEEKARKRLSAVDKAKAAYDALGDDDKAKENFLKGLKDNQLALYAKVADDTDIKNFRAAKNIDVENGTPLTTTEILNNSSSKLSDEELVGLYKQSIAKEKPVALGESVEYTLNKRLENKENAVKILTMMDPKTRERLRQETLGPTMAAETEGSLAGQEKAARASGKSAQEEFKKAKAEYDRDATNVEARRAMTGALEKARQAKAEFDEVRAKQVNVRPAPGPAPRPPGNTTS